MSYSEIIKDLKSIQKQLRPDELYLRTTNAYCDCDTILGALNSSETYKKLLNSQKVKNLKKKKWTTEQIDDWIHKKLEVKNPKFKRLTKNEKENKIKRWIDFIQEILASDKVKRIGILKHWYVSSLSFEEFNIKETKRIQRERFDKDLLLNVEEDILYEFIPSYKN